MGWATVAALMLLPMVAMQWTHEVNWDLHDFVAFGLLLVGTGIACELAVRVFAKAGHRVGASLAIIFVSFLVWLELAVGIFG
jgi:hypothetical protein